MPKARPKTGEPRVTHQPFGIDRLPEDVQDAIRLLRSDREVGGLTWAQIEERSARPYSAKWKQDRQGFVDWDTLPIDVLQLFPQLRIPRSNLHRWFFNSLQQARQDVLEEGDAAQKFIAAIAGKEIEGMDEAVMNAMSREVFNLIQSTGTGDRTRFIGALNETSLVLARLGRLQLTRKKVAADERKLKLLEQREALAVKKLEAETERLTKKASSGQPITPEDLADVRKKTFGF